MTEIRYKARNRIAFSSNKGSALDLTILSEVINNIYYLEKTSARALLEKALSNAGDTKIGAALAQIIHSKLKPVLTLANNSLKVLF